MYKINFFKILSILLISSLICVESYAVEFKDSNLFIKSDKLTLNQKEHTAVYIGNVKVFFEDMRLQTSKLIVCYEEQNGKKNLTKIIIPNTLVAFKDESSEIVKADQGSYDLEEHKLILIGNVNMTRNDNVLVTDKLIYFTNLKNSNNKNNAK